MEGQGPEHSSARLNGSCRCLLTTPTISRQKATTSPFDSSHDINWIVANCTTPANLFHILRRQIAMPESYRTKGPHPENPSGVEKVIFCSGKVFFDLKKAIKEKNLEAKIALTRVEQLTPFPFDLLKQECTKYSNASIVWCQEEHKNQGGWTYIKPRLKQLLQDNGIFTSKSEGRGWFSKFFGKSEPKPQLNEQSESVPDIRVISYVGRPVAASTATGSKAQHLKELAAFLEDATRLS
ncbi:hypothetical protein NQ318_001402 [Aromia moschata]|uniref:2-oxoglutarate dehydrogenase E1 component/KDG C-terminal domain-containing protein n=1 Tax=Aromia moschata TaxID=1265417 RepID=A0AAV8YVN9_9CUCU|nr:hypothetical protein NQ318_001402 [Aromia moschata]